MLVRTWRYKTHVTREQELALSQRVHFTCVCGTTYSFPKDRPLGAVTCTGCGLTPLSPQNFEAPDWPGRWDREELVPAAALRPFVLL